MAQADELGLTTPGGQDEPALPERNASPLSRSPTESLQPARAPEPPERPPHRPMHPILAFLNRGMTLLVVVLALLAGVFYFAKIKFDQPGPLQASTTFVIPKGEGLSVTAERLESEGIIADRRIFVASALYFKYLRSKAQLKAGEYEFRKNASMRMVLDAISQGKELLRKFTVVEGLTSDQVVERLNAEPELEGSVAQMPAEGSLLPDTYKFSRGTTRQELLDRMQSEQEKFVRQLWDNREQGLPIKTPREALILASIVEKETGRADERARVAAVFVNRLKQNMRLQSDPTIIYGLVGGKGPLGRPILRSEIDQSTPYNTYQIDGLPPTPIGNPGRSSIEAVLNPGDTKDIYFVADGTGGHAFAPTLDEHRRNVLKWRDIERKNKEQAEAEAQIEAGQVPPGGGPGLIVTNVPGLNTPKSMIPAPEATRAAAARPEGEAVPPANAGEASAPEDEAPADVPLPTRKPKTKR